VNTRTLDESPKIFFKGDNMKPNKEVSLYGLEQLALIIKMESEVTYSNQAGGYACMQPSCEGVLTIIEDDTKIIINNISKQTINKTKLTFEDADIIDSILQLNAGVKHLLIDRDKLKESMEAWIHVLINHKNDNSTLKGFIENKGILTWNNSD
jgi:hypothetical protein